MRDPSIHIKKSDLKKVLTQVMPRGVDIGGLADRILTLSRPFSLNSRSLNVSTERVEKKVEKMLASPTKDADLMARVIYITRIKLKHKGVQQIKPTSRDWGVLKQLTASATDFCLDFGLSKREGYAKYISLALSKIKTFNLVRLLPLHEAICRAFQAIQEINNDPTPKLTDEIHNYYRVKVAKSTGMINNFKAEPDRYVFFVRVAKEVTNLSIKYPIYIDAQFRALEYNNSYPEPPQLIGQKAKERLNKYLYEKGIKI